MATDSLVLSDLTAPSNIALIKYMGKMEGNIPTNGSLSYTLNHLTSRVRVSAHEGRDEWRPLGSFEMDQKGQQRFLNFLGVLKQENNVKESFLIESSNNFPSDCGLASSASSFAALTKGVMEAFYQVGALSRRISDEELSGISRKGSGSSCRSFFSPWAIWEGVQAEPFESALMDIEHRVVVVHSGKKKVSSSEAHRRVPTSLQFEGRTQRANDRLNTLKRALETGEWQDVYEITWADMWDMHNLFETSQPPFYYMLPESLNVLRRVQDQWTSHKMGPIVTMDAGANVHLLYQKDDSKTGLFVEELSQEFKVIGDAH